MYGVHFDERRPSRINLILKQIARDRRLMKQLLRLGLMTKSLLSHCQEQFSKR
jgi:hypothetical protein